MEKQFKKGDTVRRIKDEHGACDMTVGDIGTVLSCNKLKQPYTELRLQEHKYRGEQDECSHNANHFELVKRYQIKAGDTVEIIQLIEGAKGFERYVGGKYMITRAHNYPGGRPEYRLEGIPGAWLEDELELVEEAKKMALPAWNVGGNNSAKTISFDEVKDIHMCNRNHYLSKAVARFGTGSATVQEIIDYFNDNEVTKWLRVNFPDRFVEEWTDVTGEISVKLMPMNSGGAYQVKIIHDHKDIGFFTSDGFIHIQWSHRKNYKFEKPSMGSFIIFNKD